MKAEKVS